MPEYRMLHTITGTHDGVDWPKAGEQVTLSLSEGSDLVTAGIAVEVADAPTATEKATVPTTPKRRG